MVGDGGTEALRDQTTDEQGRAKTHTSTVIIESERIRDQDRRNREDTVKITYNHNDTANESYIESKEVLQHTKTIGSKKRNTPVNNNETRNDTEYEPLSTTVHDRSNKIAERNDNIDEYEATSTYFGSSKQYALYFVLLLWEIVRTVFQFVFKFIYEILRLVASLLMCVFKLIVIIVLVLYFLISLCIPDCRKSPLLQSRFSQRHEVIDSYSDHKRFLFLDLDNTLVYVTNKRPTHRSYKKIQLKAADSASKERLYIIKRPFLDNFLKEVS